MPNFLYVNSSTHDVRSCKKKIYGSVRNLTPPFDAETADGKDEEAPSPREQLIELKQDGGSPRVHPRGMRVNLSPADAQHLLRHPLRLLHRFGDGDRGRRRRRNEASVSDAALGAVGRDGEEDQPDEEGV